MRPSPCWRNRCPFRFATYPKLATDATRPFFDGILPRHARVDAGSWWEIFAQHAAGFAVRSPSEASGTHDLVSASGYPFPSARRYRPSAWSFATAVGTRRSRAVRMRACLELPCCRSARFKRQIKMATHVTSMRDGHAFQAWGPWRVAAKAAAKSPDT